MGNDACNYKDVDAEQHATLPKQCKPHPKSLGLTLEERFALVRSVAQECTTDEELMDLLRHKEHPIAYDGFEPSGRIHIAQALLRVHNVNKMTQAGCHFIFWVADWFALLNNKMDGNIDSIRAAGRYYEHVWKCAGMDMEKVQFLWAADEINGKASEYWPRVLDISRVFSINRIKRCCTIMGKAQGDSQPAAHIMYPLMQCADIFHLKADICQLGMDQRKVNMLAREYAADKKYARKPVMLSHGMIRGLLEGQEKMSKSDPNSAIFIDDDFDSIKKKMKKAYCLPKVVVENPCVEYVKYIVLPIAGRFHISRKQDNGGDATYIDVDTFTTDYESGAIHPADLKPALAEAINNLIDPIRKYFREDPAGIAAQQALDEALCKQAKP